jgi:hypothetical protein
LQRARGEGQSWKTLVAGFSYVRNQKIVLGAISLDMFAVLLGGAIALMPVFARDVLELGPTGPRLLRASPGIGAIGMAIYLASRPVRGMPGAPCSSPSVYLARPRWSSACRNRRCCPWLR